MMAEAEVGTVCPPAKGSQQLPSLPPGACIPHSAKDSKAVCGMNMLKYLSWKGDSGWGKYSGVSALKFPSRMGWRISFHPVSSLTSGML